MICGIQKKTQDDSSTSYGNGKLFQCKICQKSGKRADAVFCDLCRQYAHSSCCNFDLKNAVRLPSYNCRYCMRQAFGMFRNFLAFKKKGIHFSNGKTVEACQLWNETDDRKTWAEYYPFVCYQNEYEGR